jgi:transcriptional regulator with XRE-family HTH domain
MPDEEDLARGARLRAARIETGLSQDALGVACGVKSSYRWEAGIRSLPKETARTAAEALGVRFDWLWSGALPKRGKDPVPRPVGQGISDVGAEYLPTAVINYLLEARAGAVTQVEKAAITTFATHFDVPPTTDQIHGFLAAFRRETTIAEQAGKARRKGDSGPRPAVLATATELRPPKRR